MRDRARSMSESIFTIAFPVLMAIIYLRKDIFTNLESSQGNEHFVSFAGHSITVLTITLTIMGIISWICVYSANFIGKKILPSFSTDTPNRVVRVYGYLMIGAGCLMFLTSIALFLLFKQNYHPLQVTLAIIFFFCYLGLFIFYYKEDHGSVIPEADRGLEVPEADLEAREADTEHRLQLEAGITKPEAKRVKDPKEAKQAKDPLEAKLEHLLEFAAGITNLFFVALTGRAIDNFGTSNLATSNENSTQLSPIASKEQNSAQLTVHSHFDLNLFFLLVGSLFGIFIMVLISVANKSNCAPKITISYILLLIAVMGNVVAVTWELVKGYAFLEILPGLVSLLVYLKVILNDNVTSRKEKPNDNGQHKPVTLTFTNIAFAGLAAAIAFNEKNKGGSNFKWFAAFASAGLVCAVIWRLLTHDSENDPHKKMLEKFSCGLTLLLLFLTVGTSPFIVWG